MGCKALIIMTDEYISKKTTFMTQGTPKRLHDIRFLTHEFVHTKNRHIHVEFLAELLRAALVVSTTP